MNQHPSPDDGEADDEVTDSSASLARHDFQPTKKKRGRPPKVRHDSPESTPINGFGEPFVVTLAPGWVGFWASAKDQDEMSFRPWTIATWKDPRVIGYQGARRPDDDKKGNPIRYKELQLMLMSKANADALTKHDPKRQRHQALRSRLGMPASSNPSVGMSVNARGIVEHKDQLVTV